MSSSLNLFRFFVSFFSPAKKNPSSKVEHFLIIDLIRSAAAIAVVFWHWQHFFYPPGSSHPIEGFTEIQPFYFVLRPLYDLGYYSVQLFWTISGFVFSVVYHDSTSSTRAFAVNRLARLYPLHLITLLFVLFLQGLAIFRFGSPLIYLENSFGDFVLQLFFASNWLPSSGYSFNGPIWSVSVEILIYAVFWCILPHLFKRGVAISMLISISFHLIFLYTKYYLFGCGAYFFMGCTIYIFYLRTKPSLQITIALTAAMLGLFHFKVPFFCFSIVLAAVAFEELGWFNWLKPLRWLGDSTYGIYLWHFPLQLTAMLIFPMSREGMDIAKSPLFLIGFLISLILIALISYRYIESPARRKIRAFALT